MAQNVRNINENTNLERLIDGLNEDLANEYTATIMYTYNASAVTGLYRTMLKPFFENEINDEIGHALYLSDKIKTLGGTPTTTPKEVKQLNNVKDMLKEAKKAEEDTIQRYEQRKRQAEELGYTELVVKLDDMIADEAGHRDEIGRLLQDSQLH
ncbi:ferritin-like domain-containing protein [Aquibacillus sp. 3ASR75-11]|uniref:Ferritin-like domain-containing protein n=1 Tax=Terrihalobacillus insolitus TaxID=2950438 RepID=A0A9X3WW15_9BACI|nr:ferritin-like domain-containing protein [Terrihalobacillus insolitus]MDC3413752.1 ferritin-like domain-containing protein [Terrihalobacillus insolitus]MDC3425613.1 ferritin-like domain-containing protein [Terrihalobacillus insolitus]